MSKFTSRLVISGTAAVAALVIVVGSALAESAKSHDPLPSIRAIGGAQAPNARIAALVVAGGTVRRSKGILGVTHPSAGQYCIDPTNSLFDVNKAIPVVSVDWSSSSGPNGEMAQWRSSGVGCPLGQIAVLTFELAAGIFSLSDNVGFSIIVP